ncbi:MAG: hypothetical protein AAFW98_14540, partial [Pseudomonadota bacterium]
PMGFHPVRGWVQLYSDGSGLLRSVGGHGLRQSISEIEQAIRKSVAGKAYVHYRGDEVRVMNQASGHRFGQMATCLEISALDHLLTRVASLTSNWINQIEGQVQTTQAQDELPPPPAAA